MYASLHLLMCVFVHLKVYLFVAVSVDVVAFVMMTGYVFESVYKDLVYVFVRGEAYVVFLAHRYEYGFCLCLEVVLWVWFGVGMALRILMVTEVEVVL